MATIYNKVKTGGVELSQLQQEINENAIIIPSCLSISTVDGVNLDISMADSISVGAETELNNVITNHIPLVNTEDEIIQHLPTSPLGKLAVHSSSMPNIPGKTFYDVFTGAGDDVVNHEIGNGEVCQYAFAPGIDDYEIHVKFDPLFGDVYLHGAYLKFQGGGFGDFIQSEIKAEGSVMQDQANLVAEIDGDGYVIPSATPTHGFGGTPNLIMREYALDGEWDYDGVNLVPNMTAEGNCRININEMEVHRYVNKLPCLGDSPAWLEIETSEAALVPPGYFICIKAINGSNSSWTASVLINIYREVTIA